MKDWKLEKNREKARKMVPEGITKQSILFETINSTYLGVLYWFFWHYSNHPSPAFG